MTIAFSPGSARGRRPDLAAIALIWAVARVPLVLFHFPPQVQFDSFCYRPPWVTFFNPHYPVFYGTFLLLFPPWLVIGLQHLFVLVSAFCLYEIGRQGVNRCAGLVAAAFVVTYGDFVLYGHTFMSETVFNLLLALHLLALWRALEQRSGGAWFRCGLLAGLATLVRPILQYQVPVLALALLPFSLRPARRRRWYARAVSALALGFALVYLPMAALTRLCYGEFTLSSGLAKVMMYRLVWDEAAPLQAVALEEPRLAAIRDYLVDVGKDGQVIWSAAYAHIRESLLGVREPLESWANRQVDPLVKELWWRYVGTYPWRYVHYSLTELWRVFRMHSTFADSAAFTRRALAERPESVYARASSPAGGPEGADPTRLDRVYVPWAAFATNPVLVAVVLLFGLLSLAGGRSRARAFFACLYLSAAYLAVPQFLVSIGILRYRYPFDLIYGLLLGVVIGELMRRARSLRPRTGQVWSLAALQGPP